MSALAGSGTEDDSGHGEYRRGGPVCPPWQGVVPRTIRDTVNIVGADLCVRPGGEGDDGVVSVMGEKTVLGVVRCPSIPLFVLPFSVFVLQISWMA